MSCFPGRCQLPAATDGPRSAPPDACGSARNSPDCQRRHAGLLVRAGMSALEAGSAPKSPPPLDPAGLAPEAVAKDLPRAHAARRGRRRSRGLRARGAAPLRHRCLSRHHARPLGPWVPLPAARGWRAARRGGARADPSARHSSRLDEGLDLPARGRAPAGDGTRRARTQAVPLSRAVPRRARRDEVRPAPALRCGPAAHPRAGRKGPLATRTASREGPRARRPAARDDLDPRRQPRVHAAEPLLRADDHAQPPRGRRRGHGALRVPREERQVAERRASRTDALRPSSGAARRCPDRSSSSTTSPATEDDPSTLRT